MTEPQRTASSTVTPAPSCPQPAAPKPSTHRRNLTLPSASDVPNLSRPAFSTLQQHYSPKKSTAPKPPIPASTTHTASSASISTAANDTASSTPVLRLQAELLQLHLLHASSANILQQWSQSAERALQSRFNAVGGQWKRMRQREREVTEQTNLHALLEWGKSGTASFGGGLGENVAVLGGVLQELWVLTEGSDGGGGGRYVRLVGGFESWLAWVQEIWEGRGKGGDEGESGVELVDAVANGLGDAWKEENRALERKLGMLQREMEGLTDPAEGSDAARVVRNFRSLLQGCLEELKVMRDVEAEVVVREKGWVEQQLQRVEREIDMGLLEELETRDGSEAWRCV
ncbi:hypothetical protein W97_02483 [Coniosporium apollinis CBS 100218]|uniref:Uncharacterized protein n=1 Tax=Coniosporium apollinis (strain CBS 100218) TaxID=1168221 RepID=R7YNN2_CONA1|nr:uncharacterized protein W97_02483 [Coniosporium apollinis CBS 100218]EON63256.1 hypothetical protein W97_02483 [Coniosporium apollinis CBS 100218]